MIYLLTTFYALITLKSGLVATQNQQQQSAPALLLTTYDSVSIVYPKEMGYEKDYLQVIYKLLNAQSSSSLSLSRQQKPLSINRIEDAIYDSHAACVYIAVSYANSGGCEILRLKQQTMNETADTNAANSNNEQLALYWSRQLFYKNATASILNMDFNEKKRKLYWLEYNYSLSRWSVVIARVNGGDSSESSDFHYHTFDNPRFSYDGYSFMSVVYDEMEPLAVVDAMTFPRTPKKNKNTHVDHQDERQRKLATTHAVRPSRTSSGELVVFITNNQTLNVCFLSNLTCRDFFRADNKADNDAPDDQDYYDTDDRMLPDQQQRQQQQQADESKFGRLMGVQYEPKERALYLADYGYDRIEKIYISINTDYSMRTSQIKLSSVTLSDMQTLVQSNSGQNQMPINPIMSVSYDNHIFWTDFEDGLKSTVYKSPCIRPVYRVKNATALKLIYIVSKRNSTTSTSDSQLTKNRYMSSIQKNQFQYPPDYDFYYTTTETMMTTNEPDSLALKIAFDARSSKTSGALRQKLPLSVWTFFPVFNFLFMYFHFK
jgi:hypothetical protein